MKPKKIIPFLLAVSMLGTNVFASDIYYNLNEREQGSTYLQSTPVELPCSVTGHIDANTTDIDFYSLHVERAIHLSVALNVLQPNLAHFLRLELYDTDRSLLIAAEEVYEDEYSGFIPLNAELASGHYYLKIYAEPSAEIVNVPYLLDLSDSTLLRETDGYEKIALSETSPAPIDAEEIISATLRRDPHLEPPYRWAQTLVEQNDQDLSAVNDPMAAFQYQIPQIRLIDAWKETMGNPEIKVAVIDQGIDTSILDLSGAALPVYNVRGAEITDLTPIDHGNHVSGLICAAVDNGFGVAGVAPNITLMPINAWDVSVHERTDEDTAKAIRYAADHGARVLSMSIGNQNHIHEDGDVPVIREAVQYAYEKGVVMVACTQNAGKDVPDYPARYPEVIAVGAIKGDGEMWPDSNKGADIVAPGCDVVSLGAYGKFLPMSGTSMATPIVAGAAALILSKNPSLSNDEVREILQNSATDLGDFKSSGHGLLNVAKALEMTPEPEHEVWKIDAVRGMWYETAVRSMYALGFFREEEAFDADSMRATLTKTEWAEMLKQYAAIPLSADEILAFCGQEEEGETLLRGDAFEMLAKVYGYLYGEQELGGTALLQGLEIVAGCDQKGSTELERVITKAESAQLLYRLNVLIRA